MLNKWQKKPFVFEAGWKTLKTCKGKNVACNIIWNLLLLRRSQLHIFTSCNSHLRFLTLAGGRHNFIINGFLKSIKFIQWHFQIRNFNFVAVEVTKRKFKTTSFLVYLLPMEIFFRPMGDDNIFHFHFKNAEWAGNFVVYSPEVSLTVISFRHPFRLPVWDFGRPRVHCRCLLRPGGHLAAVLSHSLSISASQI